MGSLLVTVAVALAVGLASGGSLAALARLPLPGARWLVVAVVAQLAGVLLPLVRVAGVGLPLSATYRAGLVLSLGAVTVFLVRNRWLPGAALVGLGLAANVLVISLNGAMPVRLEAAARAGVETGPLADDGRHEPAGTGTRLGLLGDVIAVPWPVRGEVLSPGDVLVLAGVAQLLVAGTRRGRAHAGSKARPPA